jgi:hypothetical protein
MHPEIIQTRHLPFSCTDCGLKCIAFKGVNQSIETALIATIKAMCPQGFRNGEHRSVRVSGANRIVQLEAQ